MHFSLDHVVVAVGNLERAVADYRAQGFTVSIGGRHPPPRTSSNALIAFDDGAYLELIGWDPPNPAERWSNLLREHGEGVVDFALLPGDIARAVSEAQARGLPLDGPLDGRRVRPDGLEVRWQTARQKTFDLPFLCADVTPRDVRVPSGAARTHANGTRGIGTVTVAVRDVDASIARYEALLGTAPRKSPEGAVVTVGGTAVHLEPATGDREGPRGFTLV